LKAEGAGNAGCPMHPQPGVRILVVKVCTPVFTVEAPETSGIPHAMVYELYALFPRTIGCVDPVGPLVPRLAARLGSTRFHQDLGTDHGAPEPRDFSVRNNAARPARSRSLTSCLALRPHAHTAPSRPPHPAPRFVTIGRNAPLHRGGISETMLLICPTRQAREDATEWHDGQIAYGACAQRPSGKLKSMSSRESWGTARGRE